MNKINNLIDVVIPVHKKDLQILEYCIDAAKKKIVNSRRIIVISKECYSENAEWFDESLFPFSFDLVREYVGSNVGWYFQQLLKLYAPLIVPDISENVLILDSDTVFFRRVKMISDDGKPFYNISKDTKITRKDFDIRVANHIKKILPQLEVKNLPSEFQTVSGISHNMVFNRNILKDLFAKVESHDGSGDPFFKIFLKCSESGHSVSEYQIYFNFLLVYYRDQIRIRKLKYKNTADINIKKYRLRFKYHYCSFHSYLRGTRGESFRIKFERVICKILEKLFYLEVWNIGVVKKNISEFLIRPNQKIEWLPNLSLANFRADPFGFIDAKGEKNIFFEHYDFLKRRGEIRALKLDNFLKIKTENRLLSDQKHVSYPYVFCDGKKNFALVESYKQKKLSLYKINEFNGFEFVCNIFENMEIIDPSIVKYEGKWWLFFTLNDQGNEKLFLAFSDNLENGWKMHKNNPVKINKVSARCAGEVFMHNNSLFRPAQNCSKTYGGSIMINKIITLNEESFFESEEIEIYPNQLGLYPHGLHTISKLGENLTLIDGKKKVFAIYKPLFCALRLMKKILVN